ncbi:hypothetical protein [Clostridium celatum]|uniref:hypothetical protein n=1 Tax=Clostridium celatum TaxID=36834 RepID=UPI001898CF0D|nr:hypothetical protein [Clostridium celatum]
MCWFISQIKLKKELKETVENYKDLEDKYLKLRKKYLEILDKYDSYDDEIMKHKELVEEISKELAYKTELLAEYHLKFGQECLEIIEKKRSRIRNKKQIPKNEDDEGVEL